MKMLAASLTSNMVHFSVLNVYGQHANV